ncbi:hypothetical protein OESDEN_16980 [Oesophagostomum dentatum]|uniref:GST N-terminal domain-containing protein n=1 Tax=Oesophagostomum dentatum TaxID=61180 RepID=A0A0B1SDD9_OESDE|nr:hypothetical protein OESDEN_16980 [Oesophagostomum dentatum]
MSTCSENDTSSAFPGSASPSGEMVKGKLYGNKDNFRTQKVLIAAKLGKTELQLAGDHPPADKFPLGVVPAYEGDVNLFGAESIAIHVAGCANACAKNCPEIVQWLQWSEGTLLPTVLGYVLPSVSAANLDKKANCRYLQGGAFGSATTSRRCSSHKNLPSWRTPFPGRYFCGFGSPASLPATRKKIGNVTRWFQTVVHQPAVKEVLGEVSLCDKPSQFNRKTI